MTHQKPTLTSLNLEFPIWEQVYTVHPLVIIGSVDSNGESNFAPKHMAFPLGWDNYFGFVCTPKHKTYQNIKETSVFTVTYPKPDQLVVTSLSATTRQDDDGKPILDAFDTFNASEIDGRFVDGGYFYLECKLLQFIDGFGENSLILSEVVAAQAMSDVIRKSSHNEHETANFRPQFAYIYPGRYSVIKKTKAFPFPKKFKK